MAENKIEILCTRPLDNMLIYKATNSGINMDIISFVETEPVISPEVIQQVQSYGLKKATVVFTSMNAVDAVTSQLTSVPDWRIYCVGGITKETVFNFFGEKTVAGTAKNAKALAEKIILSKDVQHIVFFGEVPRLVELPERLQENPMPVDEVVV